VEAKTAFDEVRREAKITISYTFFFSSAGFVNGITYVHRAVSMQAVYDTLPEPETQTAHAKKSKYEKAF
jgi:hypothetical protein